MASLHHVAIGAYDIEVMARFYRVYFQLEESDRHQDENGDCRSIWLSAGQTTLMMERIGSLPSPAPLMRQGAFLLAFSMEPDEREAMKVRLTTAGVFIESESACSMYFRDPEGNRVAVTHYPHEPSATEKGKNHLSQNEK